MNYFFPNIVSFITHLKVLVDNFAPEGSVSVEVDDDTLGLFGCVEKLFFTWELRVLSVPVLDPLVPLGSHLLHLLHPLLPDGLVPVVVKVVQVAKLFVNLTINITLIHSQQSKAGKLGF